jgi:hypothetical protein
VIAVSKATENPARASDARVRSANTSKSCKSPRFERQCAAYKCIAGDLQHDNRVKGQHRDSPAIAEGRLVWFSTTRCMLNFRRAAGMQTRKQLLETWCQSVSIMHIGHHIAASYYTKWHLWLGASATILAAVVGASIFATLTRVAADANPIATFGVGLVSMLSAALTGAVAFLKLDERAGRHTMAAANFQGLRREAEEELVKLAENRSSQDYRSFQTRWCEILKEAPPLPQSIHDRVKRDMEAKRAENLRAHLLRSSRDDFRFPQHSDQAG